MSPQQRSMLLTLHAVRLLGFAGTEPIAERFGQDPPDVERCLIDAGTNGWACAPPSGERGGGP